MVPTKLVSFLVASCVTAAVALGCASSAPGSVPDDDENLGVREDPLSATFRDGTGTYRYVDTHDGYAHTTTVDAAKFLYFRRVGGKRAVGLTMDCAWVEPANALEILDVLKRHDAKITFFISGPFIFKAFREGVRGGLDPKNFGVIKRMIDEGHEFGSHTQTHPHNNQSIDWVRENDELLQGWNAVIAQIYKGSTIPPNAIMRDYWRAPYGEYDARSLGLATKAGFPFHFGWNVDVKDAVGFPDCRTSSESRCLSPAKLTDAVLTFGTRNQWNLDGFVILSHLQNPYRWGSSPDGLDRLLDTIAAKDHVVARLSSMFIEAPSGRVGPGPNGEASLTPGDQCAAGCIYSSFCVDRNLTARRFTSASGGPLVCVRSGDCSTECQIRGL